MEEFAWISHIQGAGRKKLPRSPDWKRNLLVLRNTSSVSERLSSTMWTGVASISEKVHSRFSCAKGVFSAASWKIKGKKWLKSCCVDGWNCLWLIYIAALFGSPVNGLYKSPVWSLSLGLRDLTVTSTCKHLKGTLSSCSSWRCSSVTHANKHKPPRDARFKQKPKKKKKTSLLSGHTLCCPKKGHRPWQHIISNQDIIQKSKTLSEISLFDPFNLRA